MSELMGDFEQYHLHPEAKSKINIDELLDSLDNEQNASIMKLNTKKIIDQKIDALYELNLPNEEITELLYKLNNYRLVDELPDIKEGSYIRWINLSNPNDLKLRLGGHVCDIIIEKSGIHIKCMKRGRFFQIKLDQCIVFQKLSAQEEIILIALDHLENQD